MRGRGQEERRVADKLPLQMSCMKTEHLQRGFEWRGLQPAGFGPS
jgi:hypothetical protein